MRRVIRPAPGPGTHATGARRRRCSPRWARCGWRCRGIGAGSFTPRLVPKGVRRLTGLSDVIISLYAGGMTVRDIQYHLHKCYGIEVSHDTISKVTDAVVAEVQNWQSRPLDPVYPIVYIDAMVVKVRDHNVVTNKAAHLVIGIDLDGAKHVL